MAQSPVRTIHNDTLQAAYDEASGTGTLARLGPDRPFAVGGTLIGVTGAAKVAAVSDPVFGAGQAIVITGTNGVHGSIRLFPHLPFALLKATLKNTAAQAETLNHVPVAALTVSLGFVALFNWNDAPVDYSVPMARLDLAPTQTYVGFDYCGGLALETVDGGLLENVTITNLTMRDIVNAPIFLRLGARLRGPAGTTVGEMRRVNISNIIVYNANSNNGCIFTGIPGHAIEDVTLSNIQIWYKGGGTSGTEPGEMERDYPDPSQFHVLPDFGFFLRHIHGLTLDNVQLHTLTPDGRPAFALRDVTGLRVRDTDGVPAISQK